jgi:hypothetical protein
MALYLEKPSRTNFAYLAPLPLVRLILPDKGAGFCMDVMDSNTVNEDGGFADVLRSVIPISQRETARDLG